MGASLVAGGGGALLLARTIYLPLVACQSDICRGCDDRPLQTTCATACSISFDRVFGAISESADQDWYLSVPLGPGRYTTVLEPPEDIDLELSVYEPGTEGRVCPGPLMATSRNAGDDREEITFDVLLGGATVYMRVFPAAADQVDPVGQYTLHLSAGLPTPPPEPTATLDPATPPPATPRPIVPVPVR